jgi:hypothetical protein
MVDFFIGMMEASLLLGGLMIILFVIFIMAELRAYDRDKIGD